MSIENTLFFGSITNPNDKDIHKTIFLEGTQYNWDATGCWVRDSNFDGKTVATLENMIWRCTRGIPFRLRRLCSLRQRVRGIFIFFRREAKRGEENLFYCIITPSYTVITPTTSPKCWSPVKILAFKTSFASGWRQPQALQKLLRKVLSKMLPLSPSRGTPCHCWLLHRYG